MPKSVRISDNLLLGCLRICKFNVLIGLHFDDLGCVYFDPSTQAFQNSFHNTLRGEPKYCEASNKTEEDTLRAIKKCFKHDPPHSIWMAQVSRTYASYKLAHSMPARSNVERDEIMILDDSDLTHFDA